MARERSFHAQEVLAGVVLGDLLDAPPHLRRDEHAGIGVAGEHLAADALAAPVAVDVGGVDEGDARLDRGVEHRGGIVIPDPPQSAPSCHAPRPTTLMLLPTRSSGLRSTP